MLPKEGQERLLQQAFALWINPEIERRHAQGALPADFNLLAVQIVFWPDSRPLEVRLNQEVRCSFVVQLAAGKVGEIDKLIGLDDISQVGEVRPPPDEADAAHVTILRLRDSWCFTFDFTYNNARVAHTYTAAQEFLTTAYEALEARRYRAFVDTLFSAVELMSKTLLLGLPGDRGAQSLTHRGISSRINQHRKGNVVGGHFAPLLNQLTELRRSARYSDKDFRMEPDEASRLRIQADEMLDLITHQVARRARRLAEDKNRLP